MDQSALFLDLIKLGIDHGRTSQRISYTEAIDWKEIYTLAKVHGLSAIVLDGIERLPENLRPPKNLILKWFGEVVHNYEARYNAYEKELGSLAKFYALHRIKMMVLKGYGLSLYYPKPNHRPCGDIDIWNFGRQEEADLVLCREKGIKVDTTEHHHTVFRWKDYIVENHYDLLIKWATKTNSLLEPILKEKGMDDSRSVLVYGEKLYLPSPDFNALFLLRHSLMEFVGTGISLRLLLDWAFFWQAEYKNVDISWLMGVVEEHGMKDFFHIIDKICVEYLGFDSGIFPETESKKEYIKDRVLEDCISPEYDRRAAHQTGLVKRVIFKYRRWKAGSWKRDLCYKESQLESFLWSMRMHLMKPRSI